MLGRSLGVPVEEVQDGNKRVRSRQRVSINAERVDEINTMPHRLFDVRPVLTDSLEILIVEVLDEIGNRQIGEHQARLHDEVLVEVVLAGEMLVDLVNESVNLLTG